MIEPNRIGLAEPNISLAPPGWQPLPYPRQDDDGPFAFKHPNGLLVLISIFTDEHMGLRWLHVSFSRKAFTPSYADVCQVKKVFIGPERKAMQIHPPEREHVNIHPHCLHLWSCLSRDLLPDLRVSDPDGRRAI